MPATRATAPGTERSPDRPSKDPMSEKVMHRVIDLARRSSRPDHAVIATDARGHIVFWDEGAEQLYGWSSDDVLSRSVVDITPAELSREQAAEIMAALSAGRSWSGVFVVRSRDGRRFEASVTDIPVRDEAGNVVGVVGVSRRVAALKPAWLAPLPA